MIEPVAKGRFDRYENVRPDLIEDLRAAILARVALERAKSINWCSGDDLFTWRSPAVQELRRTLEIDHLPFAPGQRMTGRVARGIHQKTAELALEVARLYIYEDGTKGLAGAYCVEIGAAPLTILFEVRVR